MATEISSEAAKALKAFAAYDSDVFLEWIEALSDLLLSGGDANMLDKSTLSNVGGLMYALTRATRELAEREDLEWRESHSALAGPNVGEHIERA